MVRFVMNINYSYRRPAYGSQRICTHGKIDSHRSGSNNEGIGMFLILNAVQWFDRKYNAAIAKQKLEQSLIKQQKKKTAKKDRDSIGS